MNEITGELLPYDLSFDLNSYAQDVKSSITTAPTYDQLVSERMPLFEKNLIGIRDRLDAAKDQGQHTSIVIGCGGTFQSKKDGEEGYKPIGSLKESFDALQMPKDDSLHLELFDLMNLDSSQMRPEHWRFLAESVVKVNEVAGDLVDSIIITHGTDTMDRGAAYLSFALMGLPIPVIFTGSQEPAFEKSGDARDQMERALISAKLAAKEHVAEVMVVCGSKVTRGTWAAKQGDKTTNAFGPWNEPRQQHDASDWEKAAKDGTLEKLAPAFIDFGVGKPVGALNFASHALRRANLGAYRPFTRFGEAANLYPVKLTDRTPESLASHIINQNIVLLTQLGSATADDRLVAVAVAAAAHGKAVCFESPFFDSSVPTGTYAAGSGASVKLPHINRPIPVLNASPSALEAKSNYIVSREGLEPVMHTQGLGNIYTPSDLLKFYDEMETDQVREMISRKQ